jgi:KUP system potassium uptake protein
MIVLATAATVIASQAVITGGYSVARQAMQLGYIPRMKVRHTSKETIGQIYIPAINWTMMLVVVGLVLGFGSSSALAAAYGVSVSLTMLIDTVLLAIVAHALWPRGRRWVLPLCGLFLVIDLAFATANLAKVPQGGWFPLLLGLVLFTLLRTWRRGRLLLRARIREHGEKLDDFLPGLMLAPPTRVPGTAVFLSADRGVVPQALVHNLKHNKVLHERNVVLTVDTLAVPYAPRDKRLEAREIGDDFHRVTLRFGFMETPDVPVALMAACDVEGDFWIDPQDTTYFTSRETVVAGVRHGMVVWREKLFSTMHRNAAPASAYFCIPGDRLVELGTPVEI